MLACYVVFSFSIWNLLPDKAFNILYVPSPRPSALSISAH